MLARTKLFDPTANGTRPFRYEPVTTDGTTKPFAAVFIPRRSLPDRIYANVLLGCRYVVDWITGIICLFAAIIAKSVLQVSGIVLASAHAAIRLIVACVLFGLRSLVNRIKLELQSIFYLLCLCARAVKVIGVGLKASMLVEVSQKYSHSS